MNEDEKDTTSVRQGYQPKSEEFGHQPKDSTVVKGYQPQAVESKPEGKQPPSGGSNVTPPSKKG